MKSPGSVFQTIYSLPVLTHSIALTTRTPSADYGQESRFMPDYGGSLDLPNISIKQSGLCKGLPFSLGPPTISTDDSTYRAKPSNCDALIVTPISDDPHAEFQLLSLQALERDLSLKAIVQHRPHGISECSKDLYQLQFDRTILGIKLISRGDLLAVRFDKKVKIFRLKETSEVNQLLQDELNDTVFLESLVTIPERGDFFIKDICSNIYNPNIQAVGSDTYGQYQIKFFDISNSPRRPYQVIKWNSDESKVESESNDAIEGITLRKRTIRTFAQKTPALRGLQQLINLPNHLVNCLVTTDHRIALVDPRQDRLGQVYVNKSDMPLFYPIEYLRETAFSSRNEYQMYSLSNIHMRVFDTRYPGYPLNQINHMLNSDDYEIMKMKAITHSQSMDTICISSSDRLCFVTFDQSQKKSPVNPTSKHAPYHEVITSEGNRIHGLDAIASDKSDNRLFSVFTLDSSGVLQVRDYEPSDGDHLADTRPADVVDTLFSRVINQDKLVGCVTAPSPDRTGRLASLRSGSRVRKDVEEYIDLMDTQPGLEDKLISQRAIDRYKNMKEKLDKL